VEHFFKVKVVGVLLLPAAIVLALAYVETRVVDDSSSSHARARGVVWAGRTFVDRAQFARWLRSRGVRYRVWAQRHPALTGVTPRKADRAAARADANGADHRSPWLIGGAAVLVVLLLFLVFRSRRLVRWLGRTLAAFPRPPTPRGVASRLWDRRARPAQSQADRSRRRRPSGPSLPKLGRAADGVAVLGPALVLRLRRWQQRVRTGLPAAERRYVARTSAGAARGARQIVDLRAAARLRVSTQATSAAFTFRRRRSQLAWCLATVVLAAGTGFLVTALLNGA
jgi:hypothetical protein